MFITKQALLHHHRQAVRLLDRPQPVWCLNMVPDISDFERSFTIKSSTKPARRPRLLRSKDTLWM